VEPSVRSPPECPFMSKAQGFGCAARTVGPAGAQGMDPDAQIGNLQTACRFTIIEQNWYARDMFHYSPVVSVRPSDKRGVPPLGYMFLSSRTPEVQ